MRRMEMSEAFAVVLRRHRQAQRLSQETLAEKANIHPTHVSLIERSERNPSLNVAAALASALNIALSRLIEEAEALQRRGKS